MDTLRYIWSMDRKRRIALVAAAAVAFAVAYAVGAESRLSQEEAHGIMDEFAEEVKGIDAPGIFLNNFRIAATMFIPAVGVLVGLASAYSTGVVFSAMAETIPQVREVSPLMVLATPFGIMEVVSYGIAMSQSAILVAAIMRRNLRLMVVPTMVQIGIVCALLFSGAFIEFYMIDALPNGPDLVEPGSFT